MGTFAWSTVVEFVPLMPKVIGGVLLAAVGVWGTSKAWIARKRERRNRSGD